jgi:hypothetical protein
MPLRRTTWTFWPVCLIPSNARQEGEPAVCLSQSVQHRRDKPKVEAEALPAATPQQPPFSSVAGEPGRNTIRHGRSWSDRFAPDSPLEEGVWSEPVSEARPYRRSGGRAVNPGGGGHNKKIRDQPPALPIDKMSERRRVAGADQFRSAPNPSE